MKRIHYNIFQSTEISFYRKFKVFPDDLFITLLNMGYSRNTFKDIQKQMDILFEQAKHDAEWQVATSDPFATT